MTMRTIVIESGDIANALMNGNVGVLHLIDQKGEHEQFDGGCFVDLFASRPDIISISAPARASARQRLYGEKSIHVPGLIITTQDFDPSKDWVMALEDVIDSDSHWSARRLLGRLELGDNEVLWHNIRTYAQLAGPSSTIEHFKLPGGVLDDNTRYF
jgi:hypothetical protein